MPFKQHHNFMWGFTKSLLTSFKRPVFIYLTTLSVTAMALFSTGIYFLESGVNPRINEYFDALYYSCTVMTGVGLGDIAPITIGGRALSMLMMLFGTAIFVCFTATLAVLILEIEMEKEGR